jgi:predicted anti-sigma-YlaC factor YlaD
MTATDELTCEELVELITDYLEGALRPDDRARFEAHLLGCEGCLNYVRQMGRTIQMAGRLSTDSLRPPTRDRLLVAFREWKAGS